MKQLDRDTLEFSLLSKGFSSDKMQSMDYETLMNLYIEYVVLEEDYV